MWGKIGRGGLAISHQRGDRSPPRHCAVRQSQVPLSKRLCSLVLGFLETLSKQLDSQPEQGQGARGTFESLLFSLVERESHRSAEVLSMVGRIFVKLSGITSDQTERVQPLAEVRCFDEYAHSAVSGSQLEPHRPPTDDSRSSRASTGLSPL